jgi:hypothetical protein
VEVFLSSEDIAKGSLWFAELEAVLDEPASGILCLTIDKQPGANKLTGKQMDKAPK